MNKKYLIRGMAVISISMLLAVPTYAADGWQKNDAGQWMYYKDEQQVKKQWVTDAEGHWLYVNSKGIMVNNTSAAIDGAYYLFDENGYLQEGGWQSLSKTNATSGKVTYNWYYAQEDGKLYCDGWQTIGEGRFYFAMDGKTVRGGISTVGDKKYYIDKDQGCLGIGGGWLATEAERDLPTDPVKTTWYYTEADGALYYGGWKTVAGGNFYFGTNGAVTRSGLIAADSKKYYIDQEKGCLGTGGGWFTVDTTDAAGNVTSKKYYANGDFSLLADGWFVVDGVRQYFDKNGVNYKNRSFDLDGQKIFVDETGAQRQPGWFSTSGTDSKGVAYTNWYYLDGNFNALPEGFHQMEGHTFYFDKNGMNYRNRWYADKDGKRYYLDASGYLQTGGWFSVDTINSNTGATVTTWYYADAQGSCLLNGFHELDGKSYYFSTAGASYRKKWLVDAQKRKRYFNADGYMERDAWFSTESTSTITGPASSEVSEEDAITTKLTWYYADENGYIVSRDKISMDGKEYKINTNGTMFTGWDKISGSSDYYYYKGDGSKAYGWQLITIPNASNTTYSMYSKNYGDLAWFYFDPANNGIVVHTGSGYSERVIDGKAYNVNTRGMIQYGWNRYTDGNGITAYHYYMPVETGGVSSVAAEGAVNGDELHAKGKDGYLPGERVQNSWIWSEAPVNGNEPDKSATWYYVLGDGTAQHASKGKVELKDADGYHAFDYYGRTYSGFGYKSVKNLAVDKVYYFDGDNHNTAVTGVRELDVNDRRETFCFDSNGDGVTGVYDDYLYYKGRRQTGSATRGVTYDKTEGQDITSQWVSYLVDASGKVIKDAAGLEIDGKTWSSSAAGVVTSYSGELEKATTVGVGEMSVFIGEHAD